MKLTAEQREEVIANLKKYYDELTNRLENPEISPIFANIVPNYCESMQKDRENIKAMIERLENGEDLEFCIDMDKNDFWTGIIGLVALSAFFNPIKGGE